MGVGPVVPGSLITVSADVIGSLPSSYNITPSPTMGAQSAQMQALTLSMANADLYLDTKIDAETTARGVAVAAEAAQRSADDSAEIAARSAADTSLDNSIPRIARLHITLTEFSGTPFETVTGAGASPGNWIKTSAVFVSLGGGKVSDTIDAWAAFNASPSMTTNVRYKLVLTQDYGGTNVDSDIAGTVANMDGFGSNQRVTLVGSTALTVAGTWRVTLAVQTATGNTVDILGDGALKAQRIRLGP